MIRELHRMQEEGILQFEGKIYTVYFDAEEEKTNPGIDEKSGI